VSKNVLEMTKDLVQLQIEHHYLSTENIQQALLKTHAGLMSLKAREDRLETGDSGHAQPSDRGPFAANWKKSITKHAVACLECGASFKQLSIRHLSHHDLNARSYREKYGIPRSQPLAAKATTAKRREIAQVVRPWEMAPRFLQAQAAKAQAAKKTARGASKKAATAKC